MTHMMLDIETLGRKPGCPILSIGAVLFRPHTHEIGNRYYANIDLTSQLFAGFIINPETLEWWKGQAKEAQEALLIDQRPIQTVLGEFQVWCRQHEIEQVWCQGATFDAPILAEGYDITKYDLPWLFYNVRDTRTVYDVCGFDYKSLEREGVYHNALDDAIHQVKLVQAALAFRSDHE